MAASRGGELARERGNGSDGGTGASGGNGTGPAGGGSGRWALRGRRGAAFAGGLAALGLGLVLSVCGTGTVSPATTGTGGVTTTTSASSGGSGTSGQTTADYKKYSVPGPYKVGTAQFTDNGDRVVIWYPATLPAGAPPAPYTYHLRAWLPTAIQAIIPASLNDTVTEAAYANVPAASGTFPIVLFSHGYGGYPEQSTFLTAHLASWGFIVVAPDQTARDLSAAVLGTKYTPADATKDVDQQLAALSWVKAQGSTAGSVLDGHVNVNEVGIVGHSAGGLTAIATAEAYPGIKTAVALAGVPTTPPTRSFPILLMSGSSDKVVPTAGIQKFYNQLMAPKAFVIIKGTGHNVFDDVCTIAHGQGGVAAAARALKLPVPPALLALATDGCKAPDLYPPAAYPLINQSVTSELRYALGYDSSPIGLGPGLETAYAPVTATFQGEK